MIKNLDVWKIVLLNYLILTIIVPISISDAGASGGVKELHENDKASLLVVDRGKESQTMVDIEQGGKKKKVRGINRIDIIVKQLIIDGEDKYHAENTNNKTFTYQEIQPGKRDIRISFMMIQKITLTDTGQQAEHETPLQINTTMVVAPNSVYMLAMKFGFHVPDTYGAVIDQTPHHYDPKTGKATHPTDNKLSFKVK